MVLKRKEDIYGIQSHAAVSAAEGAYMSHPKDRRERFLKGQYKGEKRAFGMFSAKFRWECPESFIKWVRRYRNTTKLCGQSCCTNPRHNGWNTGRSGLTLQELKFLESYGD